MVASTIAVALSQGVGLALWQFADCQVEPRLYENQLERRLGGFRPCVP